MSQPGREAIVSTPAGEAREPRWLTVVDLLAVVAGLAIAASVCPLSVAVPIRLGLAIGFAAIFWWTLALSAGVSAAVLVRQAIHRRPARPAEWLGLLMAINLFQLPNVDRLVNQSFSPAMVSGSFGLCRWVIAGYALMAVVAGVVALSFLGRSLPHWLRTVIAGGLLILFLWGPAHVFTLEVDSLLPPASRPGRGQTNWLAVAASRHLGSVPAGLVYGVPAVALIVGSRRLGRRPLIWTEAIGAAISAFIGLSLLAFHFRGRPQQPPAGLVADRMIAPLWILGLCLLSAWIARVLMPWWERCMNDAPEPSLARVCPTTGLAATASVVPGGCRTDLRFPDSGSIASPDFLE